MVGRLADQPGCLDDNDDGLLSEEEVPEKLWMRISAADEDSDGSLSSAELSSYRLKLLDEYFAASDANADGSLSEDEVPARVWRRLATIDADESETISLEELAAFSPSFHSGGIGGHHHHQHHHA